MLNINEDGTIDVISDEPTSEDVYFEGALGYNNGVYLLNDYCKTLYSNSSIGATARSLNIEDIQNKMDLSVWDYHNYSEYGNTRTYETNKNYPYQWTQEKTEKSKIDGNLINGTIGQSEQKELTEKTYSEATTSIEVQKTYWNRNNSDMQSNFQKADTRDNTKANSMYYELLCNNGTSYYWLASRYANASSSSLAAFGLRSVNSGSVLRL